MALWMQCMMEYILCLKNEQSRPGDKNTVNKNDAEPQQFTVVIPARYSSSRFPGKPLALIDGVPMVVRVFQRCHASGAERIIVATDDERIRDVCEENGATTVMTSADHVNGTDRLAEVSALMQWTDDDIIVNVQGDEPLIPVAIIRQVAQNLSRFPDASIATLAAPIDDNADYSDPSVVKVVFDQRGMALYFSRSPIPCDRDNVRKQTVPAFRHIGLYAYRAGFLRRYADMQPCELENLEKLEQLRALYYGERIHVATAAEMPGPGVDTPEQLALVESLIQNGGAS